MSAISNNDAAKLRSDGQTLYPVVAVSPPLADIIVATADVNQATFTFPLAQITVDNKSTDFDTLVETGMLFRLLDATTGAVVTYGIIRKPTSGSTVHIDAKSGSSSGFAQAIKNPYADNLLLEVYKLWIPWTLWSRIANNTFFKEFDLAYSNQGSVPDPIVRPGLHRLELVHSDTDVATLSFDFTADWAWNSSVSSRTVNLDGGTVVSGSTASGIFTATFAPSAEYYAVRYTCTLASGKSFTAVRYVWVHVNDPASAYAPFSYRYDVRLGSDNQEEAREIDITVGAAAPAGTFYPGQACLIRFYAGFPSADLDTPSNRVQYFLGFATEASVTQRYRQADKSVKFAGPLRYARSLPNADQAIIEAASPANWTQVNALLSNPVGAVYYLLRWHVRNFFALTDFYWDDGIESLRRGAFGISETVLNDQLRNVAAQARSRIACRSDGTLRITRNPWLLTNEERNDLTLKFTVTDDDLAAQIEAPFVQLLPVATLIAGAFAHPGVTRAFRSRAPGAVAEQGITLINADDVIILPTEGQDKTNELIGHRFAEANSPVESLTLEMKSYLDIFEPADADIFILQLPESVFELYDWLLEWLASGNIASSTVLIDGVRYVRLRFYPVRVRRQWSYTAGGVSLRVFVDARFETFGQPGIKEPIERAQAIPQTNISLTPFQPFTPISLPAEAAYALAWEDDGLLGHSIVFNRAAPTWEDIS